MNFSPFPELISERLVLRKIAQTDSRRLVELRSDDRVMHFMGRLKMNAEEEATQWIQKILDELDAENGITWAITSKSDHRLLGTIGLWRIIKDHHRAEIGYLLAREYQNQGLMTEAAECIIQYRWNEMSLHSIEGHVNPEHLASIAVLDRLGFEREGYLERVFTGKVSTSIRRFTL